MPVSQPKYPVTVELTSVEAVNFSPFPAKLLSGTSFSLVVTVLDNTAAADLTGCTATLKARPNGAVVGVAAVTLATGTISTNTITFDADSGTLPSEWQSYKNPKGISIWFEVVEAGSLTKWQREAYLQIIDATHVDDANVNGTAVIVTKTGNFSLSADMSGKEICFDGGAVTMPSLPVGTTIILNNTSASASSPIILSGITASHEFATVSGGVIGGKGTLSVTYISTGVAFTRGSLT